MKILTKEVTDLRLEILKELIVSNDIEFDSKWWDRRTSPDDINAFIMKCMDKDRKEDNKKSKKK